MSDENVAGPPPGWLYDRSTGETRWWNGQAWTEHIKPDEPNSPPVGAFGAPMPRAPAPASPTVAPNPAPAQTQTWRQQPPALTSKNGPAKASLILILLLLLGVTALLWVASGFNPAMVVLVGWLNILMVIAAVVLAIVGLVIAIRRPTKKRQSIFALVVSSLLLTVILSQIMIAANEVDVAGLESEIATWATQQTGQQVRVACPSMPVTTAGTEYICTAQNATGSTWAIRVTMVHGDQATWETVQ